jgi:quinol monooxygenase YgiN
MTNEVTVFARLRAAPGKGDALAALMAELVALVRKNEPGCLAYRLHRAQEDPDLLLFYETYADEAAFERHRNAPHVLQVRRRREAEGLAAGPVAIDVCREVARGSG